MRSLAQQLLQALYQAAKFGKFGFEFGVDDVHAAITVRNAVRKNQSLSDSLENPFRTVSVRKAKAGESWRKLLI